MFNHAGTEYNCPICLAVKGTENEDTWIKQQDFVYRDDLVAVFIGSVFIKGNEGYPLIVPVKHFENLYDLPAEYGQRIMEISKKVAVALKGVRRCSGVTLVQNNEPAGDQRAFHYHLHVVPRFEQDRYHQESHAGYVSNPKDRIEFAAKLREEISRAQTSHGAERQVVD